MTISVEELAGLAADHRLVPLSRVLFADAETPVGVYRKLAAGRPGTFLLESAEPGRSFSRWSFVGVNAVATLIADGGRARWIGTPPPGLDPDPAADPLAALGEAWRQLKSPRVAGLPSLTGGFVGYLGYDVARWIETLPEHAVDELGFPELAMLLVTDVAAVDHHECTVTLIANALVSADMTEAQIAAAHADAVRRLDEMQMALAADAPATVATVGAAAPKEAPSRTDQQAYLDSVERALEAVRAGEVFQIQVGQRFSTPTSAESFDIYRVLRTLNPSPYMYFLRMPSGADGTPGIDIVGCSPEALVTVAGLDRSAASDRRHPQAWCDSRAGRRPGARTGQ